ncbi:MAG: Gfo/Idh/MocA family oxidoreductase [Candidatus Margulisbacteria bacterium]|nr:Gfo/Idh/MocA family oxidoreductase [Candidatus Margulisiibacteriota bacterium]
MKILVVGCGSIGSRHLENLRSLGGFELIAVDVDKKRLADVKAKFSLKSYDDYAAALELERPAAVIVCVPNHLHLKYAIAAARAGCHLFVEKPLSHNLDSLAELTDIIENKKLKFFMGSNWKFFPDFIKMKELLDQGVIGRVLSFTVIAGQYLPDWHPLEDYRQGYSANSRLGGGVLLDSHEIDYLQWFLSPIKKVACLTGKYSDLEIDTEDIAALIVELESGAVGTIHLDYIQQPYRRSYYLYGDQGCLEWDFLKKEINIYSKATKKWRKIGGDPAYELNQMYLAEMRHFLDILTGKAEPLTDIRQARQTLKVIEAAKRSSASGQAVTI